MDSNQAHRESIFDEDNEFEDILSKIETVVDAIKDESETEPPSKKIKCSGDEIDASPSTSTVTVGKVTVRKIETDGELGGHQEKESDPFEANDLDDAYLCEVADIVENSYVFNDDDDDGEGWSGEAPDGIDKENRFKTEIGRPHPLLIPEVISSVFQYIDSGSTLTSSRLVCRVWNKEITEKAFQTVCIRNVIHIVEPYPNGLGYSATTHSFEAPFEVPQISRIRIADPCNVITRPVVTDYLKNLGHQIKHLAFDANLWCEDHWLFLGNVFRYCRNLEELQLIGVTNANILDWFSQTSVSVDLIKLKKFIVSGDRQGEIRHHHYSTVTTVIVHNMEDEFVDGGLIANIFRRAHHLETFCFKGNFDFVECFNTMRMIRISANRSLTELELSGEGLVAGRTLRVIRRCEFRLTSLKLGNLLGRVNGMDLENLLRQLKATLQVFELLGSVVAHQDRENELKCIRFQVPVMPSLRVFKICDMSRYRVGCLDFVARLKNLQELELGTTLNRNFTAEHKLSIKSYIRSLFKVPKIILNRPHNNITTVTLTGLCPFGQTNFGRVAMKALPNLKNYSTLVYGIRDLSSFIWHVIKSETLESVSVTICKDPNDSDYGNFRRSFQATFTKQFQEVLRRDKLKKLKLILGSGVEYTRLDLETMLTFLGKQMQYLTLKNFLIYDDKAERIATLLAEKVNFTTFKNCEIHNDLSIRSRGVTPRKFIKVTLKNVELTRVNLKMRIRDYFHVYL